MREKTIEVKATGDKLTLQSGFHILKDCSETYYNTGNLVDFTRFINEMKEKGVIFYNFEKAVLVPETPNRWGDVTATCGIQKHPALEYIRAHIGREMGIDEFEEFLVSMLNYMGSDSLTLISDLKNLRISKNTKITRDKDDAGNFEYTVSRKGTDDDKFVPPEKIKFVVPIFKFDADCEENIEEFEFRFLFNFVEKDGAVSFKLKFESFDFPILLDKASKEILEKILEPIELKKYWGTAGVFQHDDSWKYKPNKVD